MNGLIELLTVADICKKLGVSRAWVIEHSNGRRRPVLPSIKLGKVRRFDPSTWKVSLTIAGASDKRGRGTVRAGLKDKLALVFSRQ